MTFSSITAARRLSGWCECDVRLPRAAAAAAEATVAEAAAAP